MLTDYREEDEYSDSIDSYTHRSQPKKFYLDTQRQSYSSSYNSSSDSDTDSYVSSCSSLDDQESVSVKKSYPPEIGKEELEKSGINDDNNKYTSETTSKLEKTPSDSVVDPFANEALVLPIKVDKFHDKVLSSPPSEDGKGRTKSITENVQENKTDKSSGSKGYKKVKKALPKKESKKTTKEAKKSVIKIQKEILKLDLPAVKEEGNHSNIPEANTERANKNIEITRAVNEDQNA